MDELKTLVSRYNKAEKYFDSEAPPEEKQLFIPEFRKIIGRINEIVHENGLNIDEVMKCE